MKKMFFIVLFGAFLFLFAFPSQAACPCAQSRTEVKISSSANFEETVYRFSFGQKIYVRVISSSTGEGKNELRLLDSEKQEIEKISLTRSGSGLYTYTANFVAPSTFGVYYLDIQIEGGGVNFSSQRNISVGETFNKNSFSSGAETVVNPDNHKSSPLPTRTKTETLSDQDSGDFMGFALSLKILFKNFLSYLRSCL